ncbi:MAG: tRNA uracil 4-sulfurtransferase ThiI [Anaerosomatales bacterium]|nr:tRNA uracil 4-sulfurtransferase ThiI [Anaerosomatales bacterium]
MASRAALVHYHEIGLKGHNKRTFERRLQENLAFALGWDDARRVRIMASRLVVPLEGVDAHAAVERLALVPGVAFVAEALVVPREPRAMEEAAIEAVSAAAAEGARTFAIKARRSATEHPETSTDINRRIGEAVRVSTGLAVDLTDPDVTCHVDVVHDQVFVYARKVPGPGGLPVGSAGRVVALLSAGIDSPVAAWRIMRRGAVVVAVHFSGRPHTDASSEEAVVEIGHVLERTGGLGRIYVVPFGELQKEISLSAPPDLRVLLYRRLMVRVADRIADEERAKALVTGESLGQVASQTLENIAAIGAVAKRPVFRPLIGNDKQEIAAEARRIGTFEISTRPQTDCCTLFMPRTPETHARIDEVDAAESALDVDRMVRDALAGMRWVDFACPVYRAPRAWPSRDDARPRR